MNRSTNSTNDQNALLRSAAHSIIRLINFIVDTLIWLVLFVSIAYILDTYVVRFSSYTINYIYSISLAILLYLGYYSLLEYYFHRTLGKLLTGTKVVYKTGNQLTFSIILKRSVARLIPIDMFFYLFSKRGLHDRLSDTLVIKNRRQ